ncbi:MAG: tetratricopeptide repeat protein [Candidatus Cloacimonadaceae bacterium]|nr:tetratricopeptide repeat protein [Candidatus Cloacimonadaceae bacterium]
MFKLGYLSLIAVTMLILISACSKTKVVVEQAPVRNPLALAYEASKKGAESFAEKDYQGALARFSEAKALFEEAKPTTTPADSIDINIEDMLLNIARVNSDLAFINSQQGMFTEALASYQTAVDIYASLALLTISKEEQKKIITDIYQNMAVTSQNAGRFEEALSYYDLLLKSDPGNEDMLNAKYNILNDNIKDEVRAFKVLKDYADVSGDYKAFLILGTRYREKGNNPEAAANFERALQLQKDPDVFSRVADFYRSINNWNRSTQLLEQLIATKPDNATTASAYRIMGDNYRQLKNIAKMAEAWEKSVALERNADIALALANHFYQQKNYNKTITYATQVIYMDSSKTAAFLLRGDSYFKQKKNTEAKADLQRIQNDAVHGTNAKKILAAIK